MKPLITKIVSTNNMEWDYVEFKLEGMLSEYIDCIWWENYHENCQPEKQHYLVPDKSIELIFTNSSIKRYTTLGKLPLKKKSQLCGLRTKPQVCILDKSPVIGVRFFPQKFYRLCQTDLEKTIDQCLFPEECFGASIKSLEENLFNMSCQKDRIHLIEDYFRDYIYTFGKAEDESFEKLFTHVEETKGTCSVNELSLIYNISLKTLERKFKSRLGISPKKYSRLIRFAEHFMSTNTYPEQKGEYNFYDQAHFIKEVKNFTGLSPEKFTSLDKGIQNKLFQKKSY